jgi:hypothetical protein
MGNTHKEEKHPTRKIYALMHRMGRMPIKRRRLGDVVSEEMVAARIHLKYYNVVYQAVRELRTRRAEANPSVRRKKWAQIRAQKKVTAET